jgi:hypothetical protein
MRQSLDPGPSDPAPSAREAAADNGTSRPSSRRFEDEELDAVAGGQQAPSYMVQPWGPSDFSSWAAFINGMQASPDGRQLLDRSVIDLGNNVFRVEGFRPAGDPFERVFHLPASQANVGTVTRGGEPMVPIVGNVQGEALFQGFANDGFARATRAGKDWPSPYWGQMGDGPTAPYDALGVRWAKPDLAIAGRLVTEFGLPATLTATDPLPNDAWHNGGRPGRYTLTGMVDPAQGLLADPTKVPVNFNEAGGLERLHLDPQEPYITVRPAGDPTWRGNPETELAFPMELAQRMFDTGTGKVIVGDPSVPRPIPGSAIAELSWPTIPPVTASEPAAGLHSAMRPQTVQSFEADLVNMATAPNDGGVRLEAARLAALPPMAEAAAGGRGFGGWGAPVAAVGGAGLGYLFEGARAVLDSNVEPGPLRTGAEAVVGFGATVLPNVAPVFRGVNESAGALGSAIVKSLGGDENAQWWGDLAGRGVVGIPAGSVAEGAANLFPPYAAYNVGMLGVNIANWAVEKATGQPLVEQKDVWGDLFHQFRDDLGEAARQSGAEPAYQVDENFFLMNQFMHRSDVQLDQPPGNEVVNVDGSLATVDGGSVVTGDGSGNAPVLADGSNEHLVDPDVSANVTDLAANDVVNDPIERVDEPVVNASIDEPMSDVPIV